MLIITNPRLSLIFIPERQILFRSKHFFSAQPLCALRAFASNPKSLPPLR